MPSWLDLSNTGTRTPTTNAGVSVGSEQEQLHDWFATHPYRYAQIFWDASTCPVIWEDQAVNASFVDCTAGGWRIGGSNTPGVECPGYMLQGTGQVASAFKLSTGTTANDCTYICPGTSDDLGNAWTHRVYSGNYSGGKHPPHPYEAASALKRNQEWFMSFYTTGTTAGANSETRFGMDNVTVGHAGTWTATASTVFPCFHATGTGNLFFQWGADNDPDQILVDTGFQQTDSDTEQSCTFAAHYNYDTVSVYVNDRLVWRNTFDGSAGNKLPTPSTSDVGVVMGIKTLTTAAKTLSLYYGGVFISRRPQLNALADDIDPS